MRSLTGRIPVRPLMPVPRHILIKRVSARSLAWCPTTMQSIFFFWRISSNQSQRSSRAAISMLMPFFLAYSWVSKRFTLMGIPQVSQNRFTNCSSMFDSLPRRLKLQCKACMRRFKYLNAWSKVIESAPPLTAMIDPAFLSISCSLKNCFMVSNITSLFNEQPKLAIFLERRREIKNKNADFILPEALLPILNCEQALFLTCRVIA